MAEETATEFILTAAELLFSEKGYAGTTTKAVAQEARVSEVTIFRHFQNKAGLLKALIDSRPGLGEGLRLKELVVHGDVRATLVAVAARELRLAAATRGLWFRLAMEARVYPEVAELVDGVLAGRVNKLARYLRRRKAEGLVRRNLNADLMAESFYVIVASFVPMRLYARVRSVPQIHDAAALASSLVDVIWAGIAPPSA